MVFFVGASSLNNVLTKASGDVKNVVNPISFAISGLSFHPRSRKRLQVHIDTWPIAARKDLVIWHDLINNSLSKHPNNNFKPCPVPELLDILTLYRERIAAIVYTQREGTPNILSALYSTKILILNVSKALLSPRKRLDRRFRRDLWRLHPTVALESSLVLKVLRKAPNLRALLKNRSKTKRPSKKQRQALRKKALAPMMWIDYVHCCMLVYVFNFKVFCSPR